MTLAMVTLSCVLLAFKVREAERQKAVVAWVEAHHGHVEDDYECPDVTACAGGLDDLDIDPPGPQWLRNLIGIDYFSRPCWVYLGDGNLDNLAPLVDIPDLKRIDVNHSRIEDLSPLAKLHNLQVLNLSCGKLQDLSPLAELKDLKYLSLSPNPRGEEIAWLHMALPNCNIWFRGSQTRGGSRERLMF